MDGYLLINDAEDIGDILQEVELHNGGPEASGSAWGVFELNSWRKKQRDVRNTTTCSTAGGPIVHARLIMVDFPGADDGC